MAKRRREDDEDEDDRPRKRRPAADDADEEDDDRPRKKARGGDGGIPPGTPRVYVHKACKGETKMPADAVRAYLENPFELGEEPETHCAECEEDVPWKECYWAETRQNLYEYLDDLRAEMVINGEDPRDPPSLMWLYPIGIAIGAGLAVGAGTRRAAGLGLWAGLGAAAVGALLGAGYMWYTYRSEKAAADEWNRKLLKRYYKRHPEAQKPKAKRRRDDD